jgi:hypothetical protein
MADRQIGSVAGDRISTDAAADRHQLRAGVGIPYPHRAVGAGGGQQRPPAAGLRFEESGCDYLLIDFTDRN